MVQAKELTVGLTSDAVNLDPQAGEELSSNILFYHIYDPLVRRNADLSFGPGLAESWELKDDTTWVFKLRQGVKFHNGEDFKASDVVFTLDRLKKSLNNDLKKDRTVQKTDREAIVREADQLSKDAKALRGRVRDGKPSSAEADRLPDCFAEWYQHPSRRPTADREIWEDWEGQDDAPPPGDGGRGERGPRDEP